jgi:hypothetical protein
MEEKSFEILHISSRESSADSEYSWLRVNLVFRVTDDHDILACKARSEEWSKTTIYEVEDPEQIHNHFLHTQHKFEKIPGSDLSKLISFSTDPEYDISDRKRSGWAFNSFYVLQYIDKFDVFVYRDYVEDNSVTRAALSMLEDLKETGTSTSRFVPFSTLTRCIDTLNNFWD